jgi:hypothetical protein
MNATTLTVMAVFAASLMIGDAQETQPQPSKGIPAPEVDPANATTPHHADEIARFLEEWMPPGEDTQSSSAGDPRGFLGHYLSTKPITEVWLFYATKLGMTPPPGSERPYNPNFYSQIFPRMGPRRTDGLATVTMKNVQFTKDSERAATLIRREPSGRVVTIFLTSAGEQTFVFVTIAPI